MKPIEFEGQNFTFTKPVDMTDEECGDLPCLRCDEGIIFCIEVSPYDIIKMIETNKIWVHIMQHYMSPIWIGVNKPFELIGEQSIKEEACKNCKYSEVTIIEDISGDKHVAYRCINNCNEGALPTIINHDYICTQFEEAT